MSKSLVGLSKMRREKHPSAKKMRLKETWMANNSPDMLHSESWEGRSVHRQNS